MWKEQKFHTKIPPISLYRDKSIQSVTQIDFILGKHYHSLVCFYVCDLQGIREKVTEYKHCMHMYFVWSGYHAVVFLLGWSGLWADDVLREPCVRCSWTHPGKSIYWFGGERCIRCLQLLEPSGLQFQYLSSSKPAKRNFFSLRLMITCLFHNSAFSWCPDHIRWCMTQWNWAVKSGL